MLAAPAVRARRRRRPLLSSLLLSLPGTVAALIAATASDAVAVPPCSEPGSGWCLARRIEGDVPGGELGFRFGEPLDMDGDGVPDIAAGSRFKMSGPNDQNGVATVWSGATGVKIREWDGVLADGLFGHAVLPLPDLDGDKLADVVISAPLAKLDGVAHGVLSARSPKTGELIWRKIAKRQENLGWHMAPAGDQNGDGTPDLFAGAPASGGGRVYLLSGKDGEVLRMYECEAPRWTFGWMVARTDDFDGDGHPDLAVGAFLGETEADLRGAVFLLSANTGALLRRWDSADPPSAFGEMLAGIGDLDGDGLGEIAISSAYSGSIENKHIGEVQIFSGVTGKEVRHWTGSQPGDLFGRMVTSAGDVDGDGTDDVAIGSPWFKVGDMEKAGHAEVRSGKTGAVLGEWPGEVADGWLGWHIRHAPDPDGKGRPALLIGSLRHPVNGQAGVGVLDLYVLRK